MKSLEERQKEWEAEHTGVAAELNMDRYKYGRPARPSHETDSFADECAKPTKDFSKKLQDYINKTKNNMSVSREMPKYQCHKKVWALKIKSIADLSVNPLSIGPGDLQAERGRVWEITPEEADYSPFTVLEEYIAKHNPQEGGYYVVYDDGYASFSPAEPFESGYTKL